MYTIKHHQNPRITCIPLNSITFLSSECNSNKTNGFWQWKKWRQLLIPFYNDTVCMNTIPQCKEYGTWNQINNLHTSKTSYTKSHSKTHWIRIENLQTKHEAWGCFKLNNTPLYNKKWVLVFFPTWNYNQYIQKKKMSTCKFSTDVKFYCGTVKVYKASAWKFLWSQNQRLGCNCN